MPSKEKKYSSLLIPYPAGFIRFPANETNNSLIGRFESMVLLHPGNIAVSDQEVKYTYAELNNTANHLAQAILTTAGDKKETIAFFAHQEAQSIVILLAILKAGKTYIAINPTFPVARIESLIRTVAASYMLVSPDDYLLWKQVRKKVPTLRYISTRLEADGKIDNPNILINPDYPPYVSYTSGTTGVPKVIIQENRGLLCQVRDYTNDFGFSAEDVFALFNPLSFGGGSFALWGALLNGAALHIYDIKDQGLQAIPEWIAREGISVLNMPPPVFRNIFGNLAADVTFKSIRVIVLAGDTMINRELEIVRQHFLPACILINMLAMTEAGLVSRYRVDLDQEPGSIIPVGFPFAGVEITIVDEQGKEVPVGQEGIIQVKTEYLSRDPRLNSKKPGDGLFPIDVVSGRCIALSEDLGRIRMDGALDHLGRKDDVVKIHGLRIDLAEVESLLYKFPAVKDVSLRAIENKRVHGTQLVAYIVPKPGEEAKIPEIYKFLSWKLPQYMMPTRFVFLERLPLNSNGKVDQSQLPEPDWDEPTPGMTYVKARNPVELQLVEIWQDLLNVRRVGIHDNFFSLGGNSLLALQMFERMESAFHVKLPLQSLLTNPTLAEIAELVIKHIEPIVPTTIAALRKGDDSPAIFMIPGGARTGISLVDLADRIHPGPSIYALEYPGMDGYLDPMDDLHALASFFIKEIRSVQPTGPYHLVGPCLGGVIAFEMAHQLLAAGLETGLLVLLDSTPPNEDMTKPRQYYRNRASSLLKGKHLVTYLDGLGNRLSLRMKNLIGAKGPLGRGKISLFIHTYWDRIRYAFHKTSHQSWLDHRLDRQTWTVFEKLQVAKKRYIAKKYPGKALIILNQLADGTLRENLWAELLGAQECHYIPGTSHVTIFSLESSLDRMAELINNHMANNVNQQKS